MCYSASANFVGSGVIASVGVATLTRVRDKRELLFGSLPLLFAVHQFLEGFVWLGLGGSLSPRTLSGVAAAYVLYAQALLPVILPYSVWLIEPGPRERRRMVPFIAVGIAVALYVMWALIMYPTAVFERGHSIVYDNPGTERGWLAIPYVFATCGAALCSGYRYMVVFGVLNLLGVLLTLWIKARAFTSIWCAYAAVVSVVIFGYFYRHRGPHRQLA